jgi:hypothetical protein
MTDVILQADGKTRDGKRVYQVVQVAEIPPETIGKKGEKKNTSDVLFDEFNIPRPKRLPWLSLLYGSMRSGHGRER